MADDIYEVDRIIGRRTSIQRRTEYMVYWKGYDRNECSWVNSSDLDCELEVVKFETRCFELRKARRSNATVPVIDRYEAEGIATLIDVAQEIFADTSPFQDEMDDFTFGSTAPQSAPASETSSPGRSLIATHGWNRAVGNWQTQRIRGAISTTAGKIFYLTEWSDGALTWEQADVFDSSPGVVADFENAKFYRERRALVRLFQQSKRMADLSMVSPRQPKFMMEKVLSRDPTQATGGSVSPGAMASPTTAFGGKEAWFDLGTSKLHTAAVSEWRGRANKEAVSTNINVGGPGEGFGDPDQPLNQLSGKTEYESSSDSDHPVYRLEQKPITAARASSEPLEPLESQIRMPPQPYSARPGLRQTAYVYIDHEEGSFNSATSGFESEEEMLESGVAHRAMPRTPTAESALTPTGTEECGVCIKSVVGAGKQWTCKSCGLKCHDRCYRQLVKRLGAGAAYARALDVTKPAKFTCRFCREYMERLAEKVVTWRADTATEGLAPQGCVDVAVKWREKSYRHLDWVPLAWLLRVSRLVQLRTVRQQAERGKSGPELAEAVDPSFLEPAEIVGVRPAAAAAAQRRRVQLAVRGVSAEAGELYCACAEVRVVWRGLDISEATWETPPNPIEGADEYALWRAAYVVWRRAETISAAEQQRLATPPREAAREHKQQPDYVVGGQLKDYQLVGAQWLWQRWQAGAGAVLADEMGMGKTIQTIAFLQMAYHSTLAAACDADAAAASNRGVFPFLVVAPTTLVGNWAREFAQWAPELVVAQLSGRAACRAEQLAHTIFRRERGGRRDLKCHVVLTSYEAACNVEAAAALAGVRWQALVVDEGHRLKNDAARTFQSMQRFGARQRVVLTGTPVQNCLRELFSVLAFIEPKAFDTATLEAKYGAAQAADVAAVRALVRPLLLRRTKRDQPLLVPPKCEAILPVTMTRLQRELYRATLTRNAQLLRGIAAAMQAGADEPRTVRTAPLRNVLMEVRRILSHPYLLRNVEPAGLAPHEQHLRLIDASAKLQLLHALLPELLARKHRLLLFAQFKDTLDILEDYLTGEDIRYERIDGDTSAADRLTAVAAFSRADGAPVFLATTRTGGVGLNLTAADTVIIYDCDFNPQADLQAMARAHRIGQKRPVSVFKLVTRDSAEERILRKATRKLELDHQIIQRIDEPALPGEDDGSEAPGDVERTLRHGADLLFGDCAEERAEERAIRYNRQRVVELLDGCARELEEKAQHLRREAAAAAEDMLRPNNLRLEDAASVETTATPSAAADFARVWAPAGERELSDDSGDADVWARLLQKAAADTASAVGSDGGGHRLRTRKRNVNYGEGRFSEASGDADYDFVYDAEDDASRDAEDDALYSAKGHGAAVSTQTTGPVVVLQNDFLAVVQIHCQRLVDRYVQSDATLGTPVPEDQRVTVEALLGEVVRISDQVTGQALVDPPMFFPTPSNMRFRQGTQLPEQPFGSTPCAVCGQAGGHGRGFCSRIRNPQFVALLHRVRQVESYWRNRHFHHFLRWYTVQYLWFVLGHPDGERVNAANCRLTPSYGINVADYMPAILEARTARKNKINLRKRQHQQIGFLNEINADLQRTAFYEIFEDGGAHADESGIYSDEEPSRITPRVPTLPDGRYYGLDTTDHPNTVGFFKMQRVSWAKNPREIRDLGEMRKLLSELLLVRSRIFSMLKGSSSEKGELSTAATADALLENLAARKLPSFYNRVSGLRYTQLRVMQVREFVRRMQSGIMPHTPATPMAHIPATPVARTPTVPVARTPATQVASGHTTPAAFSAKPVHTPAAQVSGVRPLPAVTPIAHPSPTPTSTVRLTSITPAARSPAETGVSAHSAAGILPAIMATPGNLPAADMLDGLDKVFESLQQVYQKLSQRMSSGQTNGKGHNDDRDLRELCVALEQTRNFMVGTLADATVLPGLIAPLKHIEALTEKHAKSIKAKWSSEQQMKTSVEVNLTISRLVQSMKLWAQKKQHVASRGNTPLAVPSVTTSSMPSLPLQPATLTAAAATSVPLTLTPTASAPLSVETRSHNASPLLPTAQMSRILSQQAMTMPTSVPSWQKPPFMPNVSTQSRRVSTSFAQNQTPTMPLQHRFVSSPTPSAVTEDASKSALLQGISQSQQMPYALHNHQQQQQQTFPASTMSFGVSNGLSPALFAQQQQHSHNYPQQQQQQLQQQQYSQPQQQYSQPQQHYPQQQYSQQQNFMTPMYGTPGSSFEAIQSATSYSGYPQHNPQFSTRMGSATSPSPMMQAALLSGSAQADAIAAQNAVNGSLAIYQKQQQQNSGIPSFGTISGSSNALQLYQQSTPSSQQYISTPSETALTAQGSSGRAINLTSYDLACSLCNDPSHQPSTCPIRESISDLTERRVLVNHNMSLPPGIKEMTLTTIDHYLQACFRNIG
ncbi:hypothetical protein H4R24_001387 [Coemansia sp. RSA 988]|nr:hypothetical protein H4R24_001387 [Coemansia sp. RSA 988]